MGTPLRVLILEDRPSDAELILHEVRRGGFDPDWKRVDNEADFRACLHEAPDIILADYSLPQWDAPHALRVLQQQALDIPFIMISGTVGEDVAVECMKLGATDYLLKDRLSRLGAAITRALTERRARLEKQQAEEELKRLKELNETIVQTAAEGIALRDANGYYTFVNPAAGAILGSAPDELLGQHWTMIVAPGYHQDVSDAFDLQKEGETTRYEVEVLRKDGTRRAVRASSAPRFEAGQFVGTLTVFTDITEGKRAQEALARERNLLRTLIDSLPDVVYVKDTEGRFVLGNKALASQMGVPSPEYVLGKSDTDNFPSEMAAEFRADELRVMTTGEPLINKEESVVFPSGQPGWVLTTKVPLRDSRGNIIGLVGNGRDITQRKQIEELRARERNLLRTLVDSLPDLVYAKDAEGRFILANLAVAHLMGEPSAERILGRHDRDFYPPELAEAFWTDDQKVITSGDSLINKEEMILYPDGSRGWALTTKVPLRDSQGNIIGLVGNGRDITERKRASETLRHSEAKFRRFVEQSAEGITLTDEEGRIVEWNRSMEQISGLSKEQVAGRHVWTVQHQLMTNTAQAGVSIEQLHDTVVDLLRTGQSAWPFRALEQELTRADGEVRYVQLVYFPIETDKGYIAAAAVQDVTDRRRAERALRESEEIMRYVVKHDPSAIAIFDTHMRYIAVSDRYLKDFNVREADIIGKNHYEVFPELPERWRAAHQRSLHGIVQRSDGDDPSPLPDGSMSYARWECRPWYWIDGRIGGIILYIEFTTERKLAELEILRLNAELEQRIAERTTELSHIKERVEAILNSSNDIIIMCRTDGSIEQANPALTQASQLEPDEVFRRPLAALVEPSDVRAVNDALRAVVQSGAPERLEVTVQRKDGSTFEADMVLSPVVERGERLLGVVCSLRDISERKLMEAQLRQMLKQAMDMSELRARYVSMAAHDLGNPLAAIQALVTTVQVYGDRMSEAQKEAKFEEILGGIKAMADILSDVLTIGRVEGGQLKFSPAPLDLHSFCLSMVAEVLQATDSSRHIHFSGTGNSGSVLADARLLRHIIGNLLSNALKYSPVDSDVIFSLECTAQEATIRIQDSGIGIPEADKARVFTAFHRAGNARQIPGTGLGLAIVKQSVELHGGAITFESAQGQGTTFLVSLPLAAAPPEKQDS